MYKYIILVSLLLLFILVSGWFYHQEYVKAQPADLFEGIELAENYKPLDHYNPLMTQRFGADPAGLVYDNRLYVYSTHDVLETDVEDNIQENTYGRIRTLNRISSEDLVNWTDHGTILVSGFFGKASWSGLSWAPDPAYKKIDGEDKFFLYFSNNANGIGVLTSDNPVGPFKDPIGEALIDRSTPNTDIPWVFDPAVFVDDDGTAYLYYGGGVPEGKAEFPNSARVVELNEDMISLAGNPEVIEAPFFFEAAYMNKIDDTYYFSYSTNFHSRHGAEGEHRPPAGTIAYMTSDAPLGPWEYQGVILDNPHRFFGRGGNNHHSLINFNNDWYMLYHSRVLEAEMNISGGYRSTHIDEVEINADGAIKPITATREGVEQIKSLNPYKINEAETMAWSAGIETKETDEPGKHFGELNMVVTGMSTGSFIGVSGVDFGPESPDTFTVKAASENKGNVIKIAVGDPKGEALGYLEIPNTGDKKEFIEKTIEVQDVTGEHDLFFIFAGESFYFDSWSFE